MPDETQSLTSEKQTLLALRALRRRVEELEQARREPIAIVGMACRLPGGIDDPEAYWKLLIEKRTVVTDIPGERLDLEPIFDSHPQTPGKTYSRRAGLLASPGEFDAEFFGISPREALSTDPQQRLLLEASWEALEDADIDPKTLAGKDVGVFIGISNSEYAQHYRQCVRREDLAAHLIQGSALNAAAGRLSYFYGFAGPSLAIDTACSSSLVAVDRACRSLLEGESNLALAGGVNLLVSSEGMIITSQWGMLSPSGTCRAFDAAADGFVRGEGCGIVVLKRLRDAEEAGDRILGLILGSAVNQDGASSGLTVPNGRAQEQLLERALANAGVEARQIGYVEAHGTGTTLGDPIESQALGTVFSAGKERARPLLIGSVKTNLGHLESAAGVTGLIKVVLGLGRGVIPAQLYWEGPSEHVEWDDLPLQVVTDAKPWEAIEGRRIGGVSSFGFSGTNAHVVLESRVDTRTAETTMRPAEVLVLTARTEPALQEMIERYAEFLETSGESWGEICHTAATARAVFAQRLAVVAADKSKAATQLRAWLEKPNGLAAGVSRGTVRPGERVRVGLVFGNDCEKLDSLIDVPFGGDRVQAWQSKLRSWGVEPVVVLPAGSDTARELEINGATVALLLGEAEEPRLPTVQVVGDWRSLCEGIAELFVRGVRIDWSAWEGDLKHRRVPLPTYPFQHELYWITPQKRKREQIGEPTGRKLLGMRLRTAGVRAQYQSEVGAESGQAWIAEHLVEGRAVLPATGHLELMLEAATELLGSGTQAIEDVVLQSPLVMEQSRTVQTVVEAEGAGRSRVRVYAEGEQNAWQLVSEGWIRSAQSFRQSLSIERLDAAGIRKRLKEFKDLNVFYAAMAARGMDFGESFRGLRGLWIGENEALGRIESRAAEQGYAIAPWRLDACLQIAGALMTEAGEDRELYLPLSVAEVVLYEQSGEESWGEECWSHVRIKRVDAATLAADVTISQANGSLLARLHDLRFRKSTPSKTQTAIYDVKWESVEWSRADALRGSASTASLDGHWLIFSDDQPLATEIAEQIRTRHGICSLILTEAASTLSRGGEQGLAEKLRDLIARNGPLAGVVHLFTTEMLFDRAEPPISRIASFDGYNSALSLLQTLLRENMQPTHGVWFVTRSAEEADTTFAPRSLEGCAIWALRRTAAIEFPSLRTHAVDFAPETSAADLLRVIETHAGSEMAIRNRSVLEPRLVQRALAGSGSKEEDNWELRPGASGLIDDLVSIPVPRTAPREDEVEIRVHAHGLNFRDVMNSLGMLTGMSQQLGGECAGVVRRAGARSGFRAGDRVFAFAPGSFSAFVTTAARNVKLLPKGFGFSDAAVLPVAYLTAIYGLEKLAKLQRGERILIHSAAGGLGLAAVSVARARGAEVYATAGSEQKRAYLRSLGIEHVFHSRTTDFASELMRITAGRGVDVVLNSLTGPLAESTLAVLARGGRFLEVGKRDLLTAEQIRYRRPDVQHFLYDLGEESQRDPALTPALLGDIVQMIENGQLSRLPVTGFDEPREAFRFMAQARHIGKIVVRSLMPISSRHGIAIDPAATYLISGGCGGLGLHFAAWLVNRGARHLLLVSRRAPSGSAQESIARLRATGADVQIAKADVSDHAAMHEVFRGIPKEAPLKGVLHAAGVIADHSLLNQSKASLLEVARPKWLGAWNLHNLTRELPLDFFVLFSSASALLGVPGQANYAAANAMLDALAFYRRKHKLPALSVQWGPWSTGMTELLKPANFGFGWITPEEGIMALETLLANQDTTAAVLPVESWTKFMSQRPEGTSSLFASLSGSVAGAAPKNEPSRTGQMGSFIEELEQATPAERRRLLLEHLRQQTAKILSLSPRTRIDEESALHDVGLDSLMAVELRNALQLSLNRQLSATLALDYPTLRALRDVLLTEMFGPEKSEITSVEKAADKAAAQSAPRLFSSSIDDLSESEAESLLLLELEKTELEKDHAAKH